MNILSTAHQHLDKPLCGDHTCVNIHIHVYMAVSDRTQTLFRRVFRAHHRVWHAVALNFCQGWGSYALCRCIRYSCICMSPTLTRSSAVTVHQTRWCARNTWWNNIWVLSRTATYASVHNTYEANCYAIIMTYIYTGCAHTCKWYRQETQVAWTQSLIHHGVHRSPKITPGAQ